MGDPRQAVEAARTRVIQRLPFEWNRWVGETFRRDPSALLALTDFGAAVEAWARADERHRLMAADEASAMRLDPEEKGPADHG